MRAGADEAPRVPGDLEDHERDQEPDDRVAGLPADESGARNDAQGDEPVYARVLAVGDETGLGGLLDVVRHLVDADGDRESAGRPRPR